MLFLCHKRRDDEENGGGRQTGEDRGAQSAGKGGDEGRKAAIQRYRHAATCAIEHKELEYRQEERRDEQSILDAYAAALVSACNLEAGLGDGKQGRLLGKCGIHDEDEDDEENEEDESKLRVQRFNRRTKEHLLERIAEIKYQPRLMALCTGYGPSIKVQEIRCLGSWLMKQPGPMSSP